MKVNTKKISAFSEKLNTALNLSFDNLLELKKQNKLDIVVSRNNKIEVVNYKNLNKLKSK